MDLEVSDYIGIILIVLLIIFAIIGLTFTALLSDRIARVSRVGDEKAFLQKLADSTSCECK
jgi:hypothetical protein